MSKDHQPSLDPAVDILHAVERGSVMSEPQNPPPVVLQRHASASELETGARVRVHSLQSANSQKYNGLEGVLGDRHEDELRWYVHLSNGVSISCKPDNLELIRAAEKKPQQSDSRSSGEGAVKRKVQKYSPLLRHVAFGSATQGQAVLNAAAGSNLGELITQITTMVNNWEQAGKGAHRKTIATALRRILEGVSNIERLRPHHPPWTKLEEACVKKVFDYKCMPYTDLLHKVSEEQQALFASFFSSGDEHSRGDSDDGSDEETNASGTAQPNKPRCQHENVTKKCMICTNCLECTGFGSSCVHHKPGRTAGQECGCGFGKSGCAKCGMCQKCQRNAAIVQKGARLSVGDLVTLTKTYADFGDASEGPLKPGPASNSRSVMSKHTRMHACGSCRLNCMTIVIFILNLEPYTSNLALAMDKDSSVRPMTFSFSCSFLLLRRCRHNTKR